MQSMVLINTLVRFWVFYHGHAIVALSMQCMLSVVKKILVLGLLGLKTDGYLDHKHALFVCCFPCGSKVQDSGPVGHEVLWGCCVLSLHQNINKLSRTHSNCG
jgi:hypothetical protein